MKRGRTDAETCHLNGWGVGTRLVGDEGCGPSTIQITGIGEQAILARMVHPQVRSETLWTLRYRDWKADSR